jgi:esterase/lipase
MAMTRTRRRSLWAGAVVAALVVVFVAGPVTTVEQPPSSAGASSFDGVDNLATLSSRLDSGERAAGVTDSGVTKRIVFASGDSATHHTPRRTPWSVVYLHGFSATRQETAPLAEEVASALGANLFETRLHGHGLPGDSLHDVTARDWLVDTEEALAIGRALGDSVLVIGTSTGGTLAAWLAEQPRAERQGLAAVVLLAPNFAPRDPGAAVLTMPWANRVLPPFMPYREWTPRNEAQRRYWTVRYPSTVLFPMQALVEHVREASLDHYELPTLVFYSDADAVVDPARTSSWIARIQQEGRARTDVVHVTPLEGDDAHVIAGRIMAPHQTAQIRDRIVNFLRSR